MSQIIRHRSARVNSEALIDALAGDEDLERAPYSASDYEAYLGWLAESDDPGHDFDEAALGDEDLAPADLLPGFFGVRVDGIADDPRGGYLVFREDDERIVGRRMDLDDAIGLANDLTLESFGRNAGARRSIHGDVPTDFDQEHYRFGR